MKNIQSYDDFINEGFQIIGDQEVVDHKLEKNAGINWSFNPPPVTVKDLYLNISSYNEGYAKIILSNGDEIVYELEENHSKPYESDFTLTVNRKILTTNFDDVVTNDSFSIVKSILDYYGKNYIKLHN